MKDFRLILLSFACFVVAYHISANNTCKLKLPYESRVGVYNGRNVIFVNDCPYPAIMYSGTEQGQKTWMDPTRKSLKDFTEQGYEIIQTDTWFKNILAEDGTFKMNLLRKQLAAIVDVNPLAKIVVRINVSAPQWWLDKHPDEICKTTNPNGDNSFSGNSAESLASEKYRGFAKKYLTQFVSELAAVPEGNHVIGIHIGGGVYGEWHYYGLRNEADCSVSMRNRFAQYGLAQYGSLKEINKKWNTGFRSLKEVEVPSYDRRYITHAGDFRDPQKDCYVIDYYKCQQKTTSSLVNELAKIVKETWPRPLIVGVFYGYFYGGFTVGAEASQMDIETIFRSSYIDYFAGPYFSRDMNGSGCYRSLAKSATLNGKIWFTEHDGGTFLGSSGTGKGKFPSIPLNEEQSIARMRRNYMYSITENGGQWWYDFGPKSQGGGWWATDSLMKEAGALLNLSDSLIAVRNQSVADVLLVSDMDSYYYMRPRLQDYISTEINEYLADAILESGCAFDKIFIMDIKKVDLSQYKTVIFGNTFYMNDKMRDYIKNKVMSGGRKVVFMCGAGYINKNMARPELISSLTGIGVKLGENCDSLRVVIDGKEHLEKAERIETRFYIDDPSVKVIGRYASGKVGAAIKNESDCTVYYFGIPFGRYTSSWKDLLKETGNRVYVENLLNNDYVSVGGGIIAIYSVSGGVKKLKSLTGIEKDVFLKPYTCRYYDIKNGRVLSN